MAEAKKILIVDDEKDLRDALRVALEAAGFLVFEADDGDKGLAEAEVHKPDLILLDITMPNVNGHQMLSELHTKPWSKNMHILLLTNADDPTNITLAIGLKSDDYIIKAQTSLEEIVKKVKQHLAGYHD